MAEQSINQRIRFLLKEYQLSVRAFSELIGQKPANTQNYVGTRNSMPGADYLQSIMEHLKDVNSTWLLTGKGDPFLTRNLSDQSITTDTKDSSIIQQDSSNAPVISNIGLEACQRALTTAQSERALLSEQLAFKEALLASKEALLAAKDVVIAAKDETISLLRGGYTRPS